MTQLEKLKITPEPNSGLAEITALFNPNSYSVSKEVAWKAKTNRQHNAPPALEFGGGRSRRLDLELFFDTTEETGELQRDVRKRTNQVAKLTRIVRDLGRPPICVVSWGRAPTGSDFPFTGVVDQLVQRFTLFRADGTPVRATLTLGLTEYLDPKKDLLETDPEFTTRLFKRGDSLSAIAAEVYGDPALWRVVAEANQLDDPRKIPIGLRLNIPKLA
jgi:nucleoid-associated protein YgaU